MQVTNETFIEAPESVYPFRLGMIPRGEEAAYGIPEEQRETMTTCIEAFDVVYAFMQSHGSERVRLGHEQAALTRFDYKEAEKAEPLYVVRAVLVQAQKCQRTQTKLIRYREADCVIESKDSVFHAETHLAPQAVANHEFNVEPFSATNYERYKQLPLLANAIADLGLR
jgi:hypothetical protein